VRLQNYLPYLVNRIGPPIEAGFADALEKAGVDLQSWRVLAVLAEFGEQPVGSVSQRTSINFSTLSRLLDRMRRKGLVEKHRDKEDGRTVTVVLTAKGRDRAEFLIPRAVAYEAAMTSDFTKAEVETFKHLLSKLYGSLSGATSDEETREAG
jgi:3-hydroxy-9,10-secoandrosta-1,3,5(10)-triene-9,17-dione monooxygenase reductase component